MSTTPQIGFEIFPVQTVDLAAGGKTRLPDSTEAITVGPLLSVMEAANILGVSETWLYRHAHELPSVRVGRLLRFDRTLLLRQFQSTTPSRTGNRLNPKRGIQMRRYQRGTVFKKGKRIKTWYGMWREDVPKPDGGIVRRQRKIRLGTVSELPTLSAAREKLAQEIGSAPSVEMTFAELVERWKAAVVPTIKNTTASYYLKELKAHVVPIFGTRQVSSIGRYDIELFLAEKARLYCRNTLRGMRVSMGRVLTWAVECRWLEKNPCAGVRLPQAGTRIKRTVLTLEQTIAIASGLNEPYSTLVLFMAITGLRIGEAIAIKWTDFDGDVLHVSRRIYEGEVGTTKTEGSERSLPIPETLLARMRALGGNDWVFRSREGTPVNPGNALKRYIRPVARELGIAIGGWHDLRHTLTTGLLRRGVDPKVVSEILGHSDVKITLDIYDHPNIESFRDPLSQIAGQLLPDVTKTAPVN
jgi:integrase